MKRNFIEANHGKHNFCYFVPDIKGCLIKETSFFKQLYFLWGLSKVL
tara:strand:- start:17521 stop:17661 length:141 start_codon:yes stop_codon:yes gene_type:complete